MFQLLLLLVTTLRWVFCDERDVEMDKKLHSKLLVNLPQHSPPKDMLNKTVYVSLELHQVLEVDQKNGFWFARSSFFLNYYSQSAMWNPSDYNDIEYMTLKQDDIWTSDLVITNAIDIRYIANPDAVFVLYNGRVTLKSSLVAVKLACSFDVTHFPFDEQTCQLRIGPAYSSRFLYNIATESDEAVLDWYTENDQWELLRPVMLNIDRTIIDVSANLGTDDFVAQVRLKRRPIYYIIVLICPNLLLYLLSSLVFALPVESGDKLSFISTILLAEVVTVSTLNDVLPESSLGFPIIAYFVIAIIIHLSFLCFASVIVNKVGQAEKKPSKVIAEITKSPKLKLLHIKPIATNYSTKNQPETAPNDGKKIDAEQKGVKITQEKLLQTETCFNQSPGQEYIVSDSAYYNLIWKTFATVLDRVFCLIHFVLQILILIVYFQI